MVGLYDGSISKIHVIKSVLGNLETERKTLKMVK